MEEDNKEIKVGDIVKFTKGTHTWPENENLYGALGMVLGLDHATHGERYYCAYSQEGRVVVEKENAVKVDESKVQELHLTDYFGEDLLKKYRGDRNNEPPVKAIEEDEIKRLKQFLTEHDKDLRVMIDGVYCGSISPDDNIEEKIKRLEGIMKNSKKKQEALSYQVGGTHYKDKAIQPVEYIVANKLDFLEGCIVKRITRHREKLGALDICKIRQECDLILQLEYGTTFEEVMEKEK